MLHASDYSFSGFTSLLRDAEWDDSAQGGAQGGAQFGTQGGAHADQRRESWTSTPTQGGPFLTPPSRSPSQDEKFQLLIDIQK